MNIKDLAVTVSKYAAALGSVLPIPGGALLGTLIGDLFGGSLTNTKELISKINNDTDAKAKLIQFELSHKERIAELALRERESSFKFEIDKGDQDLEAYQHEVEDRNSARVRESEIAKTGKRDFIPALLSITVFVGLIFLVGITLIINQDNADTDILKMVIGEFMTCIGMIIAYYFGASRRAEYDNEHRDKLLEIASVVKGLVK